MPGSSQWQVLTDKKDECWKCGLHVITVLLWTPRIGKISCEKDPLKEKYYQNAIEIRRDQDEDLAFNVSRTPLIASTFNDWRYQRMKEVVPFVM